MNKKLLIISLLFMLANTVVVMARNKELLQDKLIPLDSIQLSDPCVLADKETKTYYMTGTGGMMWTSKDLKYWNGPKKVVETNPKSWMGANPMIWAAELHQYNGKYYYFATFTNRDVIIGEVKGNKIERRACQVLVSDKPDGPYRPFGDATYLPATIPTLDGTFWVDTDGKPYMVYCGEWLQNWNGTIEKIELKPDLSGTIGKGKVLFRASDSPWSKEKNEKGKIVPNKVTDGPWLFRTKTGKLGMLWTSWIYNIYTQGVAYSKSGTLGGPWIQEEKPVTPPNFGHSMLFQTFDGQWLMSVHSHRVDAQGRYIRVPHFFKVNIDGDKLVVEGEYNASSPEVLAAPLYGKTINVIGDSYVKNHRCPYQETWHYLVADKYKMNYRNYGRNGRCLVFDRRAEKWGEPMLEYYKEMNDTADYVLVVGGHNDADYIARGKETFSQFEVGLDSLCRGLIAKYPTAKLAFVTPWRVPRPAFDEVISIMMKVCGRYSIPVFNAAERSGIYVWDAAFRKIYFQGPNDTAHLNAKGHRLFFRKGETFLLSL